MVFVVGGGSVQRVQLCANRPVLFPDAPRIAPVRENWEAHYRMTDAQPGVNPVG